MNMKLKPKDLTAAKEKMIAYLMKEYQLCYDDAKLLFIKARYITKKYKAGIYDVSGIIMGAWVSGKHVAEQGDDGKPFYSFAEFMRLFIEEINRPAMTETNFRRQD